MCMFQNGSALKYKLANWRLLKQFMKRSKIPVPEEYSDAVLHSKQGAAVLFLQSLYELLTSRQLKVLPAEPEIDFTDHAYQSQLPDHARSTAVQAIRNNLRATELMVNENITAKRTLSQAIINRHTDDRARARLRDPKRFGHRPTVGELAIRRPPPAECCGTEDSMPCCISGGEGDYCHDADKVDADEADSMQHEHRCPGRYSGVHFNETETQRCAMETS